MINLEKLNRKSANLPTPFKKTCPCTILPPPFLIFQIPRQNLLTPPHPFKKKEGGGGPNYEGSLEVAHK